MHTKSRLSTLLALGLSAASLSACTTYQLKYKNPSAQPGTKHEVKQKFFLWGHLGGDEVNLEQLCPQGVADVSSKSSFGDGLLFTLTAGLYAPRSVEVHCQSGAAYRLDTSETHGRARVTQVAVGGV